MAARFRPITLTERGELRQVWGTAAVSDLPSHIAQRMANRAMNVLKEAGIQSRVEAVHVEATGPGAGIFLIAEYEHGVARVHGLWAQRVAVQARTPDPLATTASRRVSPQQRGNRPAPGRSIRVADCLGKGTLALDDMPRHATLAYQRLGCSPVSRYTINLAGDKNEPGEIVITHQ